MGRVGVGLLTFQLKKHRFLVLPGNGEAVITYDDGVVFYACAGRKANEIGAVDAKVFGAKQTLPG